MSLDLNLPSSIQARLANNVLNLAAIDQEDMPTLAKKGVVYRNRLKEHSRLLPLNAIEIMNRWYQHNYHHPYPDPRACEMMAREGGITEAQVKQWFVNTRRRTKNENRRRRAPNGTIPQSRQSRNRDSFTFDTASNISSDTFNELAAEFLRAEEEIIRETSNVSRSGPQFPPPEEDSYSTDSYTYQPPQASSSSVSAASATYPSYSNAYQCAYAYTYNPAPSSSSSPPPSYFPPTSTGASTSSSFYSDDSASYSSANSSYASPYSPPQPQSSYYSSAASSAHYAPSAGYYYPPAPAYSQHYYSPY